MLDVTVRWTGLVHPRIVVSVLLSTALLAFVLTLGDLATVGDLLRRASPRAAAGVCVLAIGYLAAKGVQLRLLLATLGQHPSPRAFALAFAIGEMVLPIPSGIYVQNYLLQRLADEPFGCTAAATTAVLAIEALLTAAWLVALGVPGWPWLAPTAAVVALGGLAVTTLALRSMRLRTWAERHDRGSLAGRILPALLEIGDGLRAVARSHNLFRALAIGAVYVALIASAVWITARGLDLPVGAVEAASIYFFSLGVTLVLGSVLAQLGVIEAAGLAAARQWGLSASDALALLLGFRIAWMGSIWLVCGGVTLALAAARRSPHDQRDEAIH